MTGAEYHEEEIKRREEKKAVRQEKHIKPEKLLTLSTKISEHDLSSKIGKCLKWIEKLHEVRVVVTGDPSDIQKTEKLVATIEAGVAPVNGRILQKRTKDGTVKFSIMPTIKKEGGEQVKKEAREPVKKEAGDTIKESGDSVKPAKPASPKKLLDPVAPVFEAQQARSLYTTSF
jgi:translation initiation factor IF-3